MGSVSNSIAKVPVWMKVAVSEIGTKEIPGHKHEKRILEYHDTTKLDANTDETPWCSSFVNWVMIKAGFKGTDSAAAVSWVKWVHGGRVQYPRYGDIVVLKRTGGHHVGFFVGDNKNGTFKLLGGNQSNAVNVKSFSHRDVIAFIRPKGGA